MPDNNTIPVGAPPPEPMPDKVVVPEPQAEPTLLAGKFKTPADMERAYLENEKLLGKHSNELGELRGKNAAYEQMLAGRSQETPKSTGDTTTDPNSVIGALAKQYESGDITFEKALMEYSGLTAKQMAAMAQEKLTALRDEMTQNLQNALAERDMQKRVQDFNDKHKDYKEVLASGVLDGIKKENPLHDDFSAYWAYKAQEAQKIAADEAERVRKGSDTASKVLTKPGTSIQQTTKTRTADKAKLRESMMARLEGMPD